jgi:hypothetical protein
LRWHCQHRLALQAGNRQVDALVDGRTAMVNRSEQVDGSIRFDDERGMASIRQLRPGVLLIRYTGHLKVDFFEPLIVEMKREIDRARREKRQVVVIADAWDLQGVDTAYREKWVQWLKEHRPHVAAILGLLYSRQAVMAANIMSMLLGRGLIRIYADPRDFEEAVELAVPGLGWRWNNELEVMPEREGGDPAAPVPGP